MKSPPFRFACCAFIAALAWSARAENAEPEPRKPSSTIEEQIEYLEGALTEGIREMDWKMIQLAADGFKAGALTGKDLELSILRAERDASINLSGSYVMAQPAQILALGLVVRARLGDAPALEKLKSWAYAEIPPLSQAPANTDPKTVDYRTMQREQSIYNNSVSKQNWALLGLALLKQPDVSKRVLFCVLAREKEADSKRAFMTYGMSFGSGTDPLLLALLLDNQTQGLSDAINILEDQAVGLPVKLSIFQPLVMMASKNKSVMGAIGAANQYSLHSEIAAGLPKDTLERLAKPYISMIRNYKQPENANRFGYDYTLNLLLNVGNTFPEKSFDADGIAALQALRDKVGNDENTKWLKQQVDMMLKRQGVETQAQAPARDQPNLNGPAVKPPKPPEGEF